jgi:anaerobic selenocysteine-containing dehydrogenase
MTAVIEGAEPTWQPTACILCSLNCGIEVKVEDRRLIAIRGDRENPRSYGYACEKAQRLDHYQNARDRLTTPLRRGPDGELEPVDWDTAIAEVAERLAAIRDEHGGQSIFYYGGGGQANHLGGAYGAGTRAALGSVFMSNALAQEKTGEFWVDAQLYGRSRCHTAPDFEHAEVAVFVGKNPWQSHGFARSRIVLKEIARDPRRALVVIDPRRTETAELADYHLQVRPGTDAWCLSALLAVVLQEGLVDGDFLDEHTTNAEPLFEALADVDVAAHCDRAGLSEELVRMVARRIAAAESVSVLEDLGIQQAPHSTLCSYLEKLLYLVTGNFAKPGGMNIHTGLFGLGGDSRKFTATPVTGERIIVGLVPGNVIPDQILTEHPDRFRAMIVESSNPVHSLADSRRMREALAALDLVVVIDVALTETARAADYVLPAPSQFEKWEASFFTLEFPQNAFQLRAPLLDAPAGTMPEPEIHRRLVRKIGAVTDEDVSPLRAALESGGRKALAEALFAAFGERPELLPLAPVLLYETLGPTLPDGAAAAAVLWLAAHRAAQLFPDSVRRAGFEGEGLELGEALFEAILTRRSGLVFTVDEYEETWRRLASADGRINLSVPELLEELIGLSGEEPVADDDFPFVLSAGERRSSTANTIYRDPGWRKKDAQGALRMHPADAGRLGIPDGGSARLTTKRGSVETSVEVTDTLQPGYVTLPNGFGTFYPADDGEPRLRGVPPNELTASEDRDWLAGTPWHKHVRARVEAV